MALNGGPDDPTPDPDHGEDSAAASIAATYPDEGAQIDSVGSVDSVGADGAAGSEPSGRRQFHLLVCYDIADDGIRCEVAQMLSQYGPRVQLSTFELRVSAVELGALKARLAGIVQPECDQIRIYNFGTRPTSPTIIGCRTLQEWHDFIIV